MNSVCLRVVAWDESQSWTDNVAHTRNILISMLREASPISHVEAKRLVKAVLAKEATDLLLHNPSFIHPMRHALQSIGAEVELVA